MSDTADRNHTQCKLLRGNQIMYTWLPEELATNNKVLSLKNEDNTWSDGWVVVESYGSRLSSYCVKRETYYKSYRETQAI